MLRRVALAAVAGVALAVPVGCCTTTCRNGPVVSQHELLERAERQEDLRQVDETQWRRPWMKEQPDHLTPQKIEGGIL